MKRINANKMQKNVEENLNYNGNRNDRFNMTRHSVLFNKKIQPFYIVKYIVLMYACNATCIRTKAIKVQHFTTVSAALFFYIIKSILYSYLLVIKERK